MTIWEFYCGPHYVTALLTGQLKKTRRQARRPSYLNYGLFNPPFFGEIEPGDLLWVSERGGGGKREASRLTLVVTRVEKKNYFTDPDDGPDTVTIYFETHHVNVDRFSPAVDA
jgi:hypothetical protein